MNITKGQLLNILNSIDNDPQLLAKIVLDVMKRLPDSYRWQLAQQLYMEYFWDGPIVTVTNNITGVVRKFSTATEIATYLKALGYRCSPNGVRDAIKRHSKTYCNHTFDSDYDEFAEEKEITFVE